MINVDGLSKITAAPSTLFSDWATAGILKPTGGGVQGHPRSFSEAEVLIASLLVPLARDGIKRALLAAIAAYLRASFAKGQRGASEWGAILKGHHRYFILAHSDKAQGWHYGFCATQNLSKVPKAKDADRVIVIQLNLVWAAAKRLHEGFLSVGGEA